MKHFKRVSAGNSCKHIIEQVINGAGLTQLVGDGLPLQDKFCNLLQNLGFKRYFKVINMIHKVANIVKALKNQYNSRNVEGMARFGINPKNAFGISMPFIRNLAKKIGKDHGLALELWKTEIHEARILAGLIDDPKQLTEKQMEQWVKDFDSWDICDQACLNLFDKSPAAFKKALEWSKRKEEFVKRAGFALMAVLAVHNKEAADKEFYKFFSAIKQEAKDERNFVRKAVNWALRQIGKRNKALQKKAISVAKQIEKIDSKTARWIAKDALRELQRH